MKTFTYFIAFIAILITSCKNHSFLSQRYTHFKNKSGSHNYTVRDSRTAKHPAVVKNESTKTIEETNAEVVVNSENELAPESGISKAFNSNKKASTVSGVTEKIKTTVKKISHTTIQKKQQAQKRGLIFGLINLALFIVICVIFVAGVIFLILLLA